MRWVLIPIVGVFICLVVSCTKPTEPKPHVEVKWAKTFGGDLGDVGHSVKQVSGGGFIITGWTYSFGAGESDVYLVKTDADGNLLWTKTYGGASNDVGYSVQVTSDNGYIIAGYTESSGEGGQDVYLIKTDESGYIMWERTIGGTNDDYGHSVKETSDGGYIIAGSTKSFGAGGQNVYLIKIDNLGHSVWTKTFGGGEDDRGYSVQQTTDGGYIIAGKKYSFSDPNVYLVKTDAEGNLLWEQTYGGAWSDEGRSVQQTSDGGYIITGRYTEFSYLVLYPKVWLIKTDADGNKLWDKVYGEYKGHSIQQTADGGYIIAGRSDGNAYVIKTDGNGESEWSNTYGGENEDRAYSIQQTSDGGFIFTGYTYSFGEGGSDVYLVKVEP